MPPASKGLRFLPMEIVAEAKAPVAAPVADNHLEIDLAGCHRMRIGGGYPPGHRWSDRG